MNLHMATKHPNFKFECGICSSTFKSYNAAYRHTQTHFKLRYICDICGHRSQFPGDRDAHAKTHTKKKLIPCTWRGCQKQFTSKKSMWQHLQSHGPDTWNCDKCEHKPFDTYSNFRQHDRGVHGIGWRALCGKLCQWPYIRAKHQRECHKCQEIKAERENKPDNPKKFTRRNLAKLKKQDELKSDSDTDVKQTDTAA